MKEFYPVADLQLPCYPQIVPFDDRPYGVPSRGLAVIHDDDRITVTWQLYATRENRFCQYMLNHGFRFIISFKPNPHPVMLRAYGILDIQQRTKVFAGEKI
jgi:hypothetical protein